MAIATFTSAISSERSNPITGALTCFHCGLPLPAHADFTVNYGGRRQSCCCAGCAAVALAIIDGGLGDYYRHRTAPGTNARALVPERLRAPTVYDHPAVQREFVRPAGAYREASLMLEGITCAACVWLNEHHLARLPGVHAIEINYATHRVRVVWDEAAIRLSEILAAIERIGYSAYPYDPTRNQTQRETERKNLLKRLGLAGILAAQVMVLSEALYLTDTPITEHEFAGFFHWLSLLLTLPVLGYAAQPFFQGAWNDLRHLRAGMDVPVVLGIAGAFAASLWTTVTGVGTAYYDAVTMFVFLLLAGRYFETAARGRAADAAESLVHATPALATRLDGDGERIVAVAELNPGDRVAVKPGATIPADGEILTGRSSVDESLFTGESHALARAAGDKVIGGSINIGSPLTVRVERTGSDTTLAAIVRLLDRAQSGKPRWSRIADRVAGWFVIAVLVLATATAVAWWYIDPTQWLAATIAVLIVTCPCALSLATPTALACATGRLARLGLLATRAHALETLARATHFVFDKTGTLTLGRLRLVHTVVYAGLDAQACMARAAALERHSEHPIARALLAAHATSFAPATDVINTPGAGLEGMVAGAMHFLGTAAFVHQRTGLALDPARLDGLRAPGGTVVTLATRTQILAVFVLADQLRPGASDLVRTLKARGLHVLLWTGDREQAARPVAAALGIEEVGYALTPADKLARLKALEARGAVVCMVGDGVNDAPVLAGAAVSVAMGEATSLAVASADMVLLSSQLPQLAHAQRVARRTLRVIHQNLAWAMAYNLLALPAAVFGYVSPWVAALGMSASSALVVANALRLLR